MLSALVVFLVELVAYVTLSGPFDIVSRTAFHAVLAATIPMDPALLFTMGFARLA